MSPHLPAALLAACAAPAMAAAPLFERWPAPESGVDFVHPLLEDHPQAYLYHSGFAVGALCLGDVDGDAVLDLYCVSGPGDNRLFLGRGGEGFREAKAPQLAGGDRWGTGANLVDIDNDGDLDLYQCHFAAPNQLFLNDGRGGFTEAEGALGLAVTDASMAAYFADADNDGDLDAFLLCNRWYDPAGRPARPPFRMEGGRPVILEEYQRHYHALPKPGGGWKVDDYGRADYFFLNRGPGADGLPRFEDASEASGLRMKGFGLSAVWWDFDGDLDLDLYVANDFTPADRLFRNDGPGADGVPRFTDVAAQLLPATTWSSMGSDVADVDRDGRPDLFAVDMSATTHLKAKVNMGALSPAHRHLLETGAPRQAMRNHLFLNTGAGMFREAAWAAGVASTDWSWTAKFGDLDNDGWPDLFVSNGMARNFTDADRSAEIGSLARARVGRTMWQLYRDTPPMPEANLAFRNRGGEKFEKRPDWGLGLVGMSYSSAMGDLDNDGDLDLVVSDLGEQVKIFRNTVADVAGGGRGFRVRLTGAASNRMGIGARVELTDSDGATQVRWANPWTGFLGQNDTALHFGTGRAAPRQIAVRWPSGIDQTLAVPDGATELAVVEAATGGAPVPVAVEPRLAPADAKPAFTHAERPFDDFERQPLLPAKLSQLGPCLAAADADLDGDTDFFVGGAAGQAGALFINDGAGAFARAPAAAFDADRDHEDSAALWFDADRDGDPDLLVVSGSNEHPRGVASYRDRLYLNRGAEGGAVRIEPAPQGALPPLADSGSCACAADYDGDGDLDLFIGSRSVPGRYPLPPANRLLRNDSTAGEVRFTELAPAALRDAGMVTDALWADLDRDGDPDLALAIDWGHIAIFRNGGGTLAEASSAAGTASRRGWWRSLCAVDVDGDGDLDLAAGNTGINTKYKDPSDGTPALIYFGDMDGSGSERIVEAKYQKGDARPLPVRGRS